MAALALGQVISLPMDVMQTARQFRGLPHRCELVRRLDGIEYVNDSKGTNGVPPPWKAWRQTTANWC